MANPTTENNESPSMDSQPNNKHRRKKSIVWQHFTTKIINAQCTRACCNQCKKSFAYITGSKQAGTSHLKRHISLGICPVSRRNRENGQSSQFVPVFKTDGSNGHVTNPRRKRCRGSSVSLSVSFDQDSCRYELARMVIMHEYPLHMVEHPGFMGFLRSLQPQFSMLSLDSIQRDCLEVYHREKQKLLNVLSGSSGRVSLSIDMWTTDQNIGYAFITGHFIDNNWKLNRRILDVVLLPFPDSESAFNHAVLRCITGWNLDKKLLTLTVDESFANEAVRRNLKSLLALRNPLVLDDQLLIGNCYARVLSRLAQEALGSMKDTVEKVRASVKYVVTYDTHEENFRNLKKQLQVPSTKSLVLDNQTQWNTTYHMLVAASELKQVFSCLDTCDPSYRETPTMDEWKQVEILCIYLKLLFEAANVLTAPSYPTANSFFHEVWKIELELTNGAMSNDIITSNLTKPMHKIFDAYWKDCSLILAIAAVMDPRFKMRLVEFSFSRIYGVDSQHWVQNVKAGVHDLFVEYIVGMLPLPTFVVKRNDSVLKTEMPQEEPILPNGCCNPKTEMLQEDTLLSGSDEFLGFDVYISETMDNQLTRELDQYLEETVLPRSQDFDVLGWWKLNKLKYPNLSKMACDILCIPVYTVSKDSVFDMYSKKLDKYRSSLEPSTLEALVCAKDWLQCGSSDHLSSPLTNAIVKMQR